MTVASPVADDMVLCPVNTICSMKSMNFRVNPILEDDAKMPSRDPSYGTGSPQVLIYCRSRTETRPRNAWSVGSVFLTDTPE